MCVVNQGIRQTRAARGNKPQRKPLGQLCVNHAPPKSLHNGPGFAAVGVTILRHVRTSKLNMVECKRQAAIVIQRVVRLHYQRREEAARTLQFAWCASKLRTAHRLAAAVTLQRHVRGWAARHAWEATLSAARDVQRVLRGHRGRRALRSAHGAACVLQASWRRYCAIVLATARRSATVDIQRAARGNLARRHFLRLRTAVVLVQCHVRSARAIGALRIARAAALSLQRVERGHLARVEARRLAIAASIVSRWAARNITRHRAAHARHLAATVIQRGVRTLAVRRELAAQHAALCTMQCTVRAFLLQRRVERRTVLCTQQQARAFAAQLKPVYRPNARRSPVENSLKTKRSFFEV